MYEFDEIDADDILNDCRLAYSGKRLSELTRALSEDESDDAQDAATVIRLLSARVSETTAARDACCSAASRDRIEIGRLTESLKRLEDGLMEVIGLADRHRAGNNACKLIANAARWALQGR